MMMKNPLVTRLRILLGTFAVAGLALAMLLGRSDTALAEVEIVRHLSLVSTAPEADAVLAESPPEIRLFFSEPPQLPGSTIRLTRGQDALVATSETAPDKDDAKQLVIRPESALAPGAYTVHWRVIAQDGHAQRGTYGFRIAAQ